MKVHIKYQSPSGMIFWKDYKTVGIARYRMRAFARIYCKILEARGIHSTFIASMNELAARPALPPVESFPLRRLPSPPRPPDLVMEVTATVKFKIVNPWSRLNPQSVYGLTSKEIDMALIKANMDMEGVEMSDAFIHEFTQVSSEPSQPA